MTCSNRRSVRWAWAASRFVTLGKPWPPICIVQQSGLCVHSVCMHLGLCECESVCLGTGDE
jgi:hypothetical protein